MIDKVQTIEVFASGAGGWGSPLGLGGPAPLAKILRPIVEFVNRRRDSTGNGGRMELNKRAGLAKYLNVFEDNIL